MGMVPLRIGRMENLGRIIHQRTATVRLSPDWPTTPLLWATGPCSGNKPIRRISVWISLCWTIASGWLSTTITLSRKVCSIRKRLTASPDIHKPGQMRVNWETVVSRWNWLLTISTTDNLNGALLSTCHWRATGCSTWADRPNKSRRAQIKNTTLPVWVIRWSSSMDSKQSAYGRVRKK